MDSKKEKLYMMRSIKTIISFEIKHPSVGEHAD